MKINKNKSDEYKQWSFTVIMLCLVIVFVPVIVSLIFYFADGLLLKAQQSFFQSLSVHKKEIAIITGALYCLSFYFFQYLYNLRKPRKTDLLAKQRWMSEDEQEDFFGKTTIDTNHSLDIGGAPINYIKSKKILLYEKEPVHDLCVGATRSGKSRKIVRQLVMICSMAEESMIFNDPKKEMYYDFKEYLERKNYDVYCLDMRNLEYSDCWNPLDTIIDCYSKKEEADDDNADQLAQDMVTALVVDNGKGEQIWVDGQKAMIKGIILANAKANITSDKKNLFSVYQTLALLGGEKSYNGNASTKKMELSAFMESLNETDIARTAFTAVANSPEKTRGSFMTSSLATLQIFSSQKLMKVLGRSDFHFYDFTEGHKALFVCNPDEKSTYDRVASICFDQCYQSLVFEANKLSGRKLKKRVHMIFDEFGNMPAINNIQSKLTVALSRGIVYHLYVQDYKQLDDRYGNDVSSIIRSNCLLKYFISSADYGTCKEFSDTVGNETIWTHSQTGTYNQTTTNTGGSLSYQMQTRALIDPNELMTLNTQNGKGIIVHRTYFGASQVYLPDCSKYDWYEQMKTNENETKRENDSLHYAVPRCIEISDDDQRKLLGLKTSINTIPERRVGMAGIVNPRAIQMPKEKSIKEMSQYPNIKDLFWYWSMRDDLYESVLNNVHNYILRKQMEFSEKRILTKKEIKDYLNSNEFLEYINSIDIPDEEKKKPKRFEFVETQNDKSIQLSDLIERM